MRRVVVTGMGAITPIGLNVEEFWKGIHAGQIGFGPITKFDASEYKAHLAAEVKGFVGKEHMDFKAAKRMELFAQYAVAAAKEAVADAGLDMEKEDAYRCGTACRACHSSSGSRRSARGCRARARRPAPAARSDGPPRKTQEESVRRAGRC